MCGGGRDKGRVNLLVKVSIWCEYDGGGTRAQYSKGGWPTMSTYHSNVGIG